MKKFAMIAFALVAMIGFTNASYTWDVSQYYNSNKTEWTLNVGNLWPVLYDDRMPSGSRLQKVICSYIRNMCYTAETATRAFAFDIDAFQKWQEEVTGIKVEFVTLKQLLK